MSSAQRTTLALALAALVAVLGAIGWRWWQERAAEERLPDLSTARVIEPDPDSALPYLVEVPGTADGCPAAAFRSSVEPTVGPSEGYVALTPPGADGMAVIATCLGAVTELGTPEELVAELWSGAADEESAEAAWERLSVERVTSPFGAALALTSRLGTRVLTDHYVERDGWVYAVGYLRVEGTDADRPLVDAILASWLWP